MSNSDTDIPNECLYGDSDKLSVEEEEHLSRTLFSHPVKLQGKSRISSSKRNRTVVSIMEAEQEEEIESLKAIFCQDGELKIKKEESEKKIPLVERVPAQHELSPSDFNEKDSMPLLSCNSTGNCANHKLPENIIALLLLDHMRSKQSYTKLIKKWVLELGLTGRLLFCNKLILILLLGDAKNVKDYIIRNKTINVDVDAKGRSCKEKMLTVLCELPVQPGVSITEFSVMELES
uniref:RWD domain-containing protein 3 n=1 Tax=Biomphalaria glabrata TaxID=6526 RepID=A0A2C9LKW3_BIOGL